MTYYGQFSPPVDKVIHDWLGDVAPGGTFFECGAFDGVADSNCKFLEEAFGWTGVNVEASPTIYQRLVLNRPRAVNIWAALTAFDGELDFTQSYRGGVEIGVGSVLPEAVEAGCATNRVVVPARRYATILRDHGIDRVDLMSLDIEGHELAVIADMLESGAPFPAKIVAEHGHVGEGPLDAALASRYDLSRRYVNNSFYVRR